MAVDLRLALHLDDGRTAAGVRLPILTVVRTRDEAAVVGHLGPDLLAAEFPLDAAVARLRADPASPAVAALLDQRRVAGLGNMWAGELLFLHRTSPWRAVAEVDAAPLLVRARALLQEAVVSNPRQITTGDARRGRRHWVYGRAGRTCLRCGAPVALVPLERASHGHETWWCPVCQAA